MAEDQIHEAMEELKDDAVVMQMSRLVGTGVVVLTECAIVVFSLSCRPNLVSRPFLCFPLYPWLASVG